MTALLLYALTLCFDPYPMQETGVVEFPVYVDGIYRESVTTNRVTVSGLEPGRVYGFTVTAKTADGIESEPSAELRYAVPKMTISAQDRKVYFQVPRIDAQANVSYLLESTSDFQTWEPEVYVIQNEQGSVSFSHQPHRFYRVRMEVRREGCAAT